MRKKYALLGIMGLTLALASAMMMGFHPHDFNSYALPGKPYEMEFNKDKNKLETTASGESFSTEKENVVAYTGLNNPIRFTYDNLGNAGGCWQMLKQWGYFLNNDPINGIQSLSIDFLPGSSSAVKVYYSADPITSSTTNFVTLDLTTSSTDFEGFNPNYIKVMGISAAAAKIVSVTIAYGCQNFYQHVKLINTEPYYYSVEGEGSYKIGTDVTIKATCTVAGATFEGWYDENDTLISTDNSYTFTVAATEAEGVCYTPRFSGIDFKKVGSYPQSRVVDETLLASLNGVVGAYPTYDEPSGLSCYKDYYVSSTKDNQNIQLYKDIEVSGQKYRAVYMYGVRGNANGYEKEQVYYFRFDPIEWISLNDAGLAVSRYTLDAGQVYYHQTYGTPTIEEETIYANNYEHSDIRSWLNGSFKGSAFSSDEIANEIAETTVSNSGTSFNAPDSQYACNDTNDKVFLLSLNEAGKGEYGFTNDKTRLALPTDYAECMGCYLGKGYVSYWLRSPDVDMGGSAYLVNNDGTFFNLSVDHYTIGVRPAVTLIG